MEDFVSINIAKVLKEKGFNRPCVKHCINGQIYISPYSNAYNYECKETVNIPTISQVLKWLREEKQIHIQVYANACGYVYVICDTPELGASDKYNSDYLGSNDGGAWDSYEECVLDGIKYILNNLI